MAVKFEREDRAGQILEGQELFGSTQVLAGAGSSNAGRAKLSIRLMTSLLYLKHSFNLSNEELVVRRSENVVGIDWSKNATDHAARLTPARPATGVKS